MQALMGGYVSASAAWNTQCHLRMPGRGIAPENTAVAGWGQRIANKSPLYRDSASTSSSDSPRRRNFTTSRGLYARSTAGHTEVYQAKALQPSHHQAGFWSSSTDANLNGSGSRSPYSFTQQNVPSSSPSSNAMSHASAARDRELDWQSRQALYSSQAGSHTQQPGRTTPQLLAARAQRLLELQILTSKLRHCNSWLELQALFLEHRSRMNHIHLSALMVRMAHLEGAANNSSTNSCSRGRNGGLQGSGGPGSKQQQLKAFLAQLVPHVGMQLLSCGPRQLSNIMWALGKLQYTPGPAWVTEWCGCTARKLDAYTAQDLAMSACGLVASDSVRPSFPTGAPLLMIQIARVCARPDVLSNCKLQDVSNIIWALATVGIAPEAGTLRALVQHAYQLLQKGSKLQALALASVLAGASAPSQSSGDDSKLSSSNRPGADDPSSSNSSRKGSGSAPSRSGDPTDSDRTLGMGDMRSQGGGIGANSGRPHGNRSRNSSERTALINSSSEPGIRRGVGDVREDSDGGVSQSAAPMHQVGFHSSLPTLQITSNPEQLSPHSSKTQQGLTPQPNSNQQPPPSVQSSSSFQPAPSSTLPSSTDHVQSSPQQPPQAPTWVHDQARSQQHISKAPEVVGLKPQELCNLAWGLAKLNYHPGERFLSLLFSCFTKSSRLAYSTSTRTCCTVGSNGSSSAVASAAHPSHGNGSSNRSSSNSRQLQLAKGDCPQHYANMLWSMARLRYCPPSAEMAACLQGLLAPATLSVNPSSAPASQPTPSSLGSGIATGDKCASPQPEQHAAASSSSTKSSSNSIDGNVNTSRQTFTTTTTTTTTSNGVSRSYRVSAADDPQMLQHPHLKGVDVAHVLWALGVLRYKPSPALLRLVLLHTHVSLHSTALMWGIVDEHGRNAATAAAAAAAAAAETKLLLQRGSLPAARAKERMYDGSAAAALTAATAAAAQKRQLLHSLLSRMAQSRPEAGMSANELTRALWGLRQLHDTKPLQGSLRDAVAGAAMALVHGYHELDPPSLMHLAKGLSSLGNVSCPPACGEALAVALDERLGNLNAYALAHILASLAQVQYRPNNTIWEHVCARTGQLLSMSRAAKPGSFGFTPRSRAAASRQVAAAAAAAAAAPPRSKTQLSTRRSRVLFASTMAGSKELVLLLWGLAWTGGGKTVRDFVWANNAVVAARRALPSLGTEELRLLVWAMTRLQLNPWTLYAWLFEQECLARMEQLQQQGEPVQSMGRWYKRRPPLTMTVPQQQRICHWLGEWRRRHRKGWRVTHLPKKGQQELQQQQRRDPIAAHLVARDRSKI